MKTYCLVCRKNTDNLSSKIQKLKMADYNENLNVQFMEIKKANL